MCRATVTGLYLATALSAAEPIHAQSLTFDDGNGLFAICTSGAPLERERCFAYLEGFLVGSVTAWQTDQRTPHFCFGSDIPNMGRFHDIIVEGLRRIPEHRHLPGPTLVMAILKENFPCERSIYRR